MYKLTKEQIINMSNLASGARPNFRNYESDNTVTDPIAADYNIRRMGSHIYFYDEINEETQLILQQMIKEATSTLLSEHVAEIALGRLSESVTIHLNSPGGYGHCGLALYDFIKTCQPQVSCVVEGSCASAATLIFLACEHRAMSPNSTFLMHQCSWGAGGQDKLMQDLAENARKSMVKLREIYAKETKIGIEYTDPEIRDAYINSILEHDKEFDVSDCIKLGILPSSEDDELENVELSPERLERLENEIDRFAKKLAREQIKENKAKAKGITDTPAKKPTTKPVKKETSKTSKKEPAKAPAKKTTKKSETTKGKTKAPAKTAEPKKPVKKTEKSDK